MTTVYEVATQSGVYRLEPRPRTFVVRRDDHTLVGLVEEIANKAWCVPMLSREVTFERAEDAVEALLRHNRNDASER